MKQAYFAAFDPAARPATGFPAPSGGTPPVTLRGELRPCAASAGLAYEQLAGLAPLVGYVPPNGVSREDEAPVSLALLSTSTGRVLVRGGVAQPAGGWPEHSFSHVLLDVPATLDAQQAIQTWGSDQWQRSAADGLGELHDALFPPVSVALDDAAFTRFLADAQHEQLFRFVLAAVVSTPAQTRVFLAAPAEAVAQCVYGLTRVVPAAVLDGLTFSTFAHNPLACPARIVGTVPDNAEKELPPSCYDGAGVAANTLTGTKTSLDTEISFVAFAVQVAASGDYKPLDDFKGTWQRLGLKDPALLDVVYRLGLGPEAITKTEVARALADPSLAAWVCPRPGYQQQFLTWALEDLDFATGTFPRVVGALRQRPDQLAKLAEQVRDAGLAAIPAGDLTRTRSALEVLLPMVAPARGQAIWGEVLQGIPDPEALTWDMRAYLLPRLTRLRPLSVGQPPDAGMRRWLRVTTDKLTPLLGLSLSQGYQGAVCLELLHGGREDVAAVAHAVSGSPAMAMTLLQQLAGSGEEPLAGEFFAALLQDAPRPAWLGDVLQAQPPLPASLLDRALGTALDTGVTAVDPVPFVRQHGSALLERLQGHSILDRLAAKVLEGQAGELIGDPAVRDFFLGLEGKPGLSRAVEERVGAVLTVHRFLQQPSVDREPLDRVAAAVTQPELFAEATKRRLLDAAIRCLRAESFQSDLIHLLLSWAPLFGGSSNLYREVLHRFQQDRAFWKNEGQLLAFLAVALDATASEELNSRTEGLEAEAFALVDGLVRRGGKKFWAVLDGRAAEWPRSARRQWQFLSQAVLPQKGRSVARDLVAALLGAAVMAAAFLVLRWYHVV